jgi:hypothetical protein
MKTVLPSPMTRQAVASSPADMAAVEFRYGQIDNHPLFNEAALKNKSQPVVERVHNRENLLHIEVQLGLIDGTNNQTITLHRRATTNACDVIDLIRQGVAKGSGFSSPDPYCLCLQEKAKGKLELMQGEIPFQILVHISTAQALNQYPKLVYCSAPDITRTQMEKYDWDLTQSMLDGWHAEQAHIQREQAEKQAFENWRRKNPNVNAPPPRSLVRMAARNKSTKGANVGTVWASSPRTKRLVEEAVETFDRSQGDVAIGDDATKNDNWSPEGQLKDTSCFSIFGWCSKPKVDSSKSHHRSVPRDITRDPATTAENDSSSSSKPKDVSTLPRKNDTQDQENRPHITVRSVKSGTQIVHQHHYHHHLCQQQMADQQQTLLANRRGGSKKSRRGLKERQLNSQEHQKMTAVASAYFQQNCTPNTKEKLYPVFEC